MAPLIIRAIKHGDDLSSLHLVLNLVEVFSLPVEAVFNREA